LLDTIAKLEQQKFILAAVIRVLLALLGIGIVQLNQGM
jgi:hypothetical protein